MMMYMSVRTGVIRARDKTTNDFGMCMGIAIVSQDHQRLIEVMNGEGGNVMRGFLGMSTG